MDQVFRGIHSVCPKALSKFTIRKYGNDLSLCFYCKGDRMGSHKLL